MFPLTKDINFDNTWVEGNPIRTEMCKTQDGDDIFISNNEKMFLLSINKNITGFTGKTKKDGKEYQLETFIYKDANNGDQFNSKIIFNKNPQMFLYFMQQMYDKFWKNGWIHGDLDTSNIVIQYFENTEMTFRIFDFEHVEYKEPKNTTEFFKFIWSDISKILNEYFSISLVKYTKFDQCFLCINNRIAIEESPYIHQICSVLDSQDDRPLENNFLYRVINWIINMPKTYDHTIDMQCTSEEFEDMIGYTQDLESSMDEDE